MDPRGQNVKPAIHQPLQHERLERGSISSNSTFLNSGAYCTRVDCRPVSSRVCPRTPPYTRSRNRLPMRRSLFSKWSILYRLPLSEGPYRPGSSRCRNATRLTSFLKTGPSELSAVLGRRESDMHTPFYDPKISSTTDRCPVCRGKVTLSLVEPHLTHDGWEILSYSCKKCGPTRSKIVPSPSSHGNPPVESMRTPVERP